MVGSCKKAEFFTEVDCLGNSETLLYGLDSWEWFKMGGGSKSTCTAMQPG